MKPRQRQQHIVELLLGRGSIGIHELCEHFQCSGGTIRGDLRVLEAQGKLIRTFAGATLPSLLNTQRAHRAIASEHAVHAVHAVQAGQAGQAPRQLPNAPPRWCMMATRFCCIQV